MASTTAARKGFRKHLGQLAREDRLVRQMTLLDLDVEPSVDRMEELQDSEPEHDDTEK